MYVTIVSNDDYHGKAHKGTAKNSRRCYCSTRIKNHWEVKCFIEFMIIDEVENVFN